MQHFIPLPKACIDDAGQVIVQSGIDLTQKCRCTATAFGEVGGYVDEAGNTRVSSDGGI